ncbi:MAG: hypothetical protein JNM70_03965 [Anaerolineae bacterium]|nr:hypothetical protein [Anaerolineae bacterium]
MKTLLGCAGFFVISIFVVLVAMALPRVPRQLTRLYTDEANWVLQQAQAKLDLAEAVRSPEGIARLNAEWYEQERQATELKKFGVIGVTAVLPVSLAIVGLYFLLYRPIKREGDRLKAEFEQARRERDDERLKRNAAWDPVQRMSARSPFSEATQKIARIEITQPKDKTPKRPDSLPR